MRLFALVGLVALGMGCGSSGGGSPSDGVATNGGDTGHGGSGATPEVPSGGGSTSGGGSGGSFGAGSGSTSGGSSSTSGSSSGSGSDAGVPAGVLTAGAWDDNRNYDFFSGYLARNASLERHPGHRVRRTGTPRTRSSPARVRRSSGSTSPSSSTPPAAWATRLPYLQSEFANISGAIGGAVPERRAALGARRLPRHAGPRSRRRSTS